jgi:hypothetical protein
VIDITAHGAVVESNDAAFGGAHVLFLESPRLSVPACVVARVVAQGAGWLRIEFVQPSAPFIAALVMAVGVRTAAELKKW